MACAQGGKEDDDGASDGYSAGAKVSVEELLAKDAEDESLARYKAQLLGAAAQGHKAVEIQDMFFSEVCEAPRYAVQGHKAWIG